MVSAVATGATCSLLWIPDRDDFLAQTSQLADRVRNARKLEGVERIFLPGERGDLQEKQALETGVVEIEDRLYREFLGRLTVDGRR